jgi:stage V sporulation protein SpoVS
MMSLLAEADRARLAMPLAGAVKEAIKAFKIARNLPMPEEG